LEVGRSLLRESADDLTKLGPQRSSRRRTTVTSQSNKQVLERFTEFINTASPELADELIAPDASFHVPGRPEPMRGPSGYLAIIAMMRDGFPDVRWTPEEMISEGDTVAVRFTMRGTHQGTFFGVPPTGTRFHVGSSAPART
jgi:predicted ester cyclase